MTTPAGSYRGLGQSIASGLFGAAYSSSVFLRRLAKALPKHPQSRALRTAQQADGLAIQGLGLDLRRQGVELRIAKQQPLNRTRNLAVVQGRAAGTGQVRQGQSPMMMIWSMLVAPAPRTRAKRSPSCSRNTFVSLKSSTIPCAWEFFLAIAETMRSGLLVRGV